MSGPSSPLIEIYLREAGLPWMGLHSPSPFNLLIEEPYTTIFWVRFWIIFTEVRLRWVGYETHSRSQGMIQLK
ncbi:hypothetical protein Gohar_009531 [Gossypium harknessii]|uniref:Uncharacterized protein n=1 Tax=Gossypium harknessii TaxID=34285 RepID=A0A7J9GN63_9ROSI|nr:hypothetical protein [Gossypium harknessii]